MNSTNKFWLPTIIAIAVIIGIFIGTRISGSSSKGGMFELSQKPDKFQSLLNFISANYVDTVNIQKISDQSYADLLRQLDPHSAYIPASDLKGVNEVLEGNFEGVGIEFYVVNDTIMVLNVIPGGPSESVGIRSADKIVKIQDSTVAGIKITNERIIKMLRGPKDSQVKVGIKRGHANQLLNFTIKRGSIPLTSVDAAFMMDKETGYIKVNKFAQDTYIEFMQALDRLLHKENMKNLIVDLRQNGGGYLESATKILDELLDNNKLLVYTEGRNKKRNDYNCHKDGMFESGALTLLVDEGSASASEIMAGALQDWDRATIVGRRTFGKGLVQEQYELGDGSALRLTVARYYTPSGRCIQKNYKNGYDAYEMDLLNRYKHGEFQNADSIKYADTMKYQTAGGRTVYGGGGIKPDVFVPLDTSNNNNLITAVFSKGLLAQYAYTYFAENDAAIKKYKTVMEYDNGFVITEAMYQQFLAYVVQNGVDKALLKYANPSASYIKNELKAYIARQQWKMDGFIYLLNKQDKTVQKALQLIHNKPLSFKNSK